MWLSKSFVKDLWCHVARDQRLIYVGTGVRSLAGEMSRSF